MKYKTGEEMAREVADFVNNMTHDTKGFVKQMGIEHRTLQQNFTRLCMAWIKELSTRDFDDRNKASVELAKKIIAKIDDLYLPII